MFWVSVCADIVFSLMLKKRRAKTLLFYTRDTILHRPFSDSTGAATSRKVQLTCCSPAFRSSLIPKQAESIAFVQ